MLAGIAGLLVYVIVLTTGYITHSNSNIICKVALPNTKDDEPLTNNGTEYIFNCANIDSIKLVRVLGSGVYKKAYLGEYGTGRKVAVKVLGIPSRNFRHDRLRVFMKEILLLQELKHRNILKLLGFCIRGDKFGSNSLRDEGAIAVYEYGEDVHRNKSFFRQLPLPERLNIALEIIDLFIYLDNSPLGSMEMLDIGSNHFLWHDNTLKLIDLDGNWQEPSCQSRDNASCEFNLTCVDGRCLGQNAKSNLMKVKSLLLDQLLISVDVLALKRNTTGHDMMARRYGIDALKQVISMLNNKPNAQEFTFTWVRKRLMDARSAL